MGHHRPDAVGLDAVRWRSRARPASSEAGARRPECASPPPCADCTPTPQYAKKRSSATRKCLRNQQLIWRSVSGGFNSPEIETSRKRWPLTAGTSLDLGRDGPRPVLPEALGAATEEPPPQAN